MILGEKYSRDKFLIFLNSFIPNFTKDIRRVSTDGLQVTKEIFYLGESAELNLGIFELTHLSSLDARVTLAMDGFKVMKSSATYRALVIYRDDNVEDWRLSLMTAIPSVDQKGKVEQILSNPRRLSFFLGPNAKVNTPYQFLIKQGAVKDFTELQKRFSIEVVNKEFYTQISVAFTLLAGGKREIGSKSIDAGDGELKLPSTNDETLRKEFTVRLIGRLLFCWFLKKKGSDKGIALLSESLLSVKAVNENKDYYHSVLESLFFEVLNTSFDKRGNKFKLDPWSQTPFLNGGLFNPHYRDYYESGPLGFSKFINTLKITDSWFKNLFEVFETYNFTIDENTAFDVELSIEPEMLGRIFENLLAEINPETGETARKSTGSFYTPRPIVEYMVDESLKQYFLVKTALKEDKILRLLTYDNFDAGLNDVEKESVVDALDSIKIIDPACGSGAFPMGMLQKMLLILQKVDPESQSWLDKKLASISDIALRKDLKIKLKADNFNYIHKIGIIRDAIYGIDIQPIAVEISRLRFFLSLIVDEKIDDLKENRGIKPLPNLEFKFVCTNSLIGLPKVGHQETFIEAESDITILKSLRDEYLGSYGPEKKRLEKKFLEVQRRMSTYASGWALWGSHKSQTMKLSEWNPFSDEPCGWFDSEWMFGISNGFDVVIGNPPYLESRHTAFKDELKKTYQECCKNRWGKDAELIPKGCDLLVYFFETSIFMLNKKGVIVLITQNAWLDTEYGKKAQQFLMKHTNVKKIIDSEYRYFPSGEGPNINTVISVFIGKNPEKDNHLCFYLLRKDIDLIPKSLLSIETNTENESIKTECFRYDDQILSKYKWGILHNSNKFILNLLNILENKAVTIDKIPGDNVYSFGQGLNLSKSCFVDIDALHELQIEKKDTYPIKTTDDGMHYQINLTKYCLVDKNRVDRSKMELLQSKGYEPFDTSTTKKKPPILIMPRGVSKHYCSLNNISSFSASGVDVYSTIPGIDETTQNLWCFFNSSLFWLLREISGRKNLGGGLLKSEAADLWAFPVYMNFDLKKGHLQKILNGEVSSTIKEIDSNSHAEIDKIVFDYLGFNKIERMECVKQLKEMITFREERSTT